MPKSYGYHANDLQEYSCSGLPDFRFFLLSFKSRAAICADTSEYAVPINKLLKGVYLVRSDPSSEFDVDIMVY